LFELSFEKYIVTILCFRCGINGCKFVAHPKIVEKHIQMQHDTGLAEKIMRLTTPEEIEKWKEERKRYVE